MGATYIDMCMMARTHLLRFLMGMTLCAFVSAFPKQVELDSVVPEALIEQHLQDTDVAQDHKNPEDKYKYMQDNPKYRSENPYCMCQDGAKCPLDEHSLPQPLLCHDTAPGPPPHDGPVCWCDRKDNI